MKVSREENVRLTRTAFEMESAGKEKLFFSFAVPSLCLFLTAAGLVGAFVTTFSVPSLTGLLFWALFGMSLFWTAFDRLKLDGSYRFLSFLAVMVAAALLLLLMQAGAINGFFQVANGILGGLNESYHSDFVLYPVEENGLNADIFLLFVLFPVTGLLSFSIVKRQNIWVPAAVCFPILSGSCLVRGKPDERYLLCLFGAFLILMAESAVRVPEDGNYQDVKGRSGVGILLPAALLAVLSLFGLRPFLTTPVLLLRSAGAKTEGSILSYAWKALPGISGEGMQLQLEGVGGGVDEGALGKTEGYYFGTMKALRLTCDVKPEETLYLKGYVGAVYTGHSFEAADEMLLRGASSGWKTEGDPLLYVQNLPFLRMLYAENVTVSGGDGKELQMAEETVSSAAKLKVENINANPAYSYVPYCAFLNDYYRMLAGDGAVEGQTRAEDLFSYYPLSAYQERMEKWQEEAAAHGVLDGMESAYDSFVRNVYLQIPDKGLARLKETCEEAELTDLEEIRQYVVAVLAENTTFRMDVEALPEGKDFVSWFLEEKKEGYSTHYAAAATMLFRMFGVPARYVVGYAAPSGLFTMQSDGSYEAVLEDDNAHAWTEIYVSGMGWVPVETTPGFVAASIEGSSTEGVDLSGDSDAVLQEEGGTFTQETAEGTDNGQKKDGTSSDEKETEGAGFWNRPAFLWELLMAVSGFFGVFLLLFVIRRAALKRMRSGKGRKPDPEGTIRRLYGNFHSMLLFDDWEDVPGCESEDFAAELAGRYPVCSREELETFRMVILKTWYGCDKRRKKELQFLLKVYDRIGRSIYRRLSFGKKMKFIWWKCYL